MEKVAFTGIDINSNNCKSWHFITFNETGTGTGVFVQDVTNIQNAELFIKGMQIIIKMGDKRGDYLKVFLEYLMQFTIEGFNDIEKVKPILSMEYSRCIAFICDIALHSNKKLAHKGCYHKDFQKYVANLMYNYFLDEPFKIYKTTGVFSLPSILMFNK